MGTLQVRRGLDRARSRTEWLDSRHSLAFGSHYDPENTCFGPLLAHNEDLLQPGPGYRPHLHRDVEILTWVLAGSLRHRDETGESTLVAAGQLHHVSAGSGIRHTESSASEDLPVRLVQMWLSPDELGLAPSHRLLRVGERLETAELVLIASGQVRADDPDVVRIRQPGAQLSVARLPAGATVTLPAAPYVHVFLASGSATVQAPDGVTGQQALVAGDALRITDGGGERMSAGEPAELLVWQMHAGR
ncbi:MAG TPA: pirin family protein [Jatrophihabitans sp.]|uniref:pirin family protein n=1 Tax=Jatrophihabitans sp. TaxID=1932789 RepID=UPI002EE2D456